MINKLIKYTITSIIVLFFISNVSAVTYENGTLEIEGTTTSLASLSPANQNMVISDTLSHMALYYRSPVETGTPDKIFYENVKIRYIDDYVDIPQNVGGSFLMYDGTDFKGSGTLMIRKTGDVGSKICTADFYYYFDENFVVGTDVVYDLQVYSQIIKNYYSHIGCYYVYGGSAPTEYSTLNIGIMPYTHPGNMYSHGLDSGSDNANYERSISFKNEYSIKFDLSVCTISILREYTGYDTRSRLVIRDDQNDLYYTSEYFTDTDTSHVIVNDSYDFYIKPYNFIDDSFIYTSIDSTINTEPSLQTDKGTYTITDDIIIEYENLNNIDVNNDYTYDLQFYYYKNDNEIEYLYNVPLSGTLDNFNDIAYVSTTGWTPKKLYIGVINSNVDYVSSKSTFIANVKLSQFVNLTYPYEFVYDSCEGDYCQYQNGDSFKIIYNSYRNNSLNVSDSNGALIQCLGNVSGFGEIEFTIPFDDNHNNEYPQWNLTMNNTFDHIMVYWLEQEDYVSYDHGQNEEYNNSEEVEENIETLAESIKPIKELLFGCSGIIIENPDYDNNGIVESEEIDKWFNGIISIMILIVIYIFYTGLKDR